MKKRMKSYYGLFPALFFLTLFFCLPKTVSALQPAKIQEPAYVEPVVETPVEIAPEIPEETAAAEPEEDPAPAIPERRPEKEQDTPEAPQTQDPPSQEPSMDSSVEEEPEDAPEEVPMDVPQETLDSFFSDTLFIGDSRTVGLCEYSGLTTATFFADTGMSVYKVLQNQVSVPGLGTMSLEKLLQEKTFAKVHLMLGINELGYDLNTTVNAYAAVLDIIRAYQPDALIYMGANLHVGKYRSDTDTVINNAAIDRFNNAVAALADGETIFYVDVNPLFDDDTGNLRTDLSGDGTHVYGSCYPQWAQWLYAAMQPEE